MKKSTLGLLITLLWSMTSVASTAEKKALSQQTYKVLIAAQASFGTANADNAISSLNALLTQLKKTPYEQAIVLQTLAHAYIAQEDYSTAIPPLKQSVELNALPPKPQQQMAYDLIRLYMATEGFTDAINLLNSWLTQAAPPQAEAYIMLATAHLQLGHFEQAVAPLKQAITMSKAPKERWYQSLLSAYSELKQYQPCIRLLHTMLQRFPDRPIYWRQLAGIQLTEDKYSDALATMELAYLRGHIKTEQELLNLAQLYLHLNAPYKAATLIEDEIKQNHVNKTEKNWEQAANAWLLARETDKAIAALEKAESILQNPKRELRLAQLYMESRRWKEADKTLDTLINSRKLNAAETGKAWILLGIVRHKAKSTSKARAAFEQAKRYKKTANSAKQWLAFIN